MRGLAFVLVRWCPRQDLNLRHRLCEPSCHRDGALPLSGGERLVGGQEATVVMRVEDKPVVAAEPSPADSGVIGSFTLVDPDDAAPGFHP